MGNFIVDLTGREGRAKCALFPVPCEEAEDEDGACGAGLGHSPGDLSPLLVCLTCICSALPLQRGPPRP